MNNLDRFYTVDEINPKLNILIENFDKIQQEFIENKNKLVWTNYSTMAGYQGSNEVAYHGWQIAALYSELKDNPELSVNTFLKNLNRFEQNFGQKLHVYPNESTILCENSFYLPTLVDCLRQANITKRLAISVVHPGKDIKWHMDPDPEVGNNAIIRGLFGLDVRPEKDQDCHICLGNENEHEKKYFENKEFMFFWGRTRHCVVNSLQTPRYVVCFDQDIDKDYLRNLD
jgi:hypothetical protein